MALHDFAHGFEPHVHNWRRWINGGPGGPVYESCASAERLYEGGWGDDEAQADKADRFRPAPDVTDAIRVQEALQRIPIADRQLITLYYCGRKRPSELCVAFGIRFSRKLLEIYLRRALNRLEARYKNSMESWTNAETAHSSGRRVLQTSARCA